MFIDTHSHIYLKDFDDDRDEMIRRAIDNGIRKIILPNIDNSSIKSMINLAESYPDICYPLMGLHPTSVNNNYKDELNAVEQWLETKKFYGIGETGIDLYWDKTYIKEQIDSFSLQIKLAKKYRLPLIIHVRNSFDEVFEVMDSLIDENLKGVFHCFTGDLAQANKILTYGFKLGIGGVLTFKNSNLDNIIKEIDLNHIILETDSPYLAPVPKRGKRNESSYLIYTAVKLAEIKYMKVEQIADITTKNAYDLFNFS